MPQKKCNHCQQLKDEEEFNWRYKTLGVRNKSCRECQHAFNRTYYEGDAKERHLQQVKERTEVAREAAREFVYDYLLSHPCEMCGESDPRVLEFHHVGEKDMAITRMVTGGFSIKRIQAEISKCQVLGSNCHRKITVDQRGWYRGKK
jgi:hypothetical protein